jgi:hypothetical protein
MTFLSKIGSILLKGIALVSGVGSVVGQQIPGTAGTVTRVIGFLSEIAPIVTTVETIGQIKNIPGPEKAKLAGPLIGQVILQSDFMSGKKIDQPDLFKLGCERIAGGVADILNSLRAEDVKEVSKT